jgi:tRNA-Thr(GGU) m(6)t(6)A37 methyltransferase TsaA
MPDAGDATRRRTDAITVQPIGWVENARYDLKDDRWGGTVSTIVLDPQQLDASAVQGLDQFSHIEVLFHVDRVPATAIHRGARRPRENPEWPAVGILAQRAAARPNRLGVTRCRLLKVEGLRLTVSQLDAVDGTPVLDVKPYLEEFGPRGAVHQPEWSRVVMRGYFD